MGETPTHQLSDEERSALAERLGYRSIGAQLPEGVTLSKIINSLPKDVSTQPDVLASQQAACLYAVLLTDSLRHCLDVRFTSCSGPLLCLHAGI